MPKASSLRDTGAVLHLRRAEVALTAVCTAIGTHEAAVAYALSREQFGKPIPRHQQVQRLLSRGRGNITASIARCKRV